MPKGKRQKKDEAEQAALELAPLPTGELRDVPVNEIQMSPFQMRAGTDEVVLGLVPSVKQDGVLIPIRVRPVTGGKQTPGAEYEVVFGHRRLAAARAAGLETIRCEVVDVDDVAAFRSLLVENRERLDLTPLEEAKEFAFARDRFDWSVKAIAAACNCSESHVRDRLALLTIPEPVKQALADERISARDAQQLAKVAVLGDAVVREALQNIDQRDVDYAVDEAFRGHTIPLNEKTPFAWQEVCKEKGCLGKDQEGRPVCTSPSNYVAAVAEQQGEAMAEALAAFIKGHKRDGELEMLPVYYDLSDLSPLPSYRQVKVKQPKGLRVCPLPVLESLYADDGRMNSALVWSEHLRAVADKEGCRACPAWTGQGAGRALLVEPARPDSWDSSKRVPTVQLLCMDRPCRKAKQDEGKSATEKRAEERERQLAQAQAGLQDQALAAVETLTGEPVRCLAAAMVRRDGKELYLEYGYSRVVKVLGVNVPEGGDQLLFQLMELGQETLLRMLALRQVERLDGALDYRDLWMPKKLAATLEVLTGQTLKDQLEASIEQAQTGVSPAEAEAEAAAQREDERG